LLLRKHAEYGAHWNQIGRFELAQPPNVPCLCWT
jgi:hypothetical protein